MDNILVNLARHLSRQADVEVVIDEPMSRHTTFRIGGPAEIFIQVRGEKAATYALKTIYDAGVQPIVIGNGSNLLVSDLGIRGVVVKIAGGNCVCEGKMLKADAGVSMVYAAKCAQRSELSGLEFLYGIPGSIGGAVVMNAGAYGGEICQVLEATKYLSADGKVYELGLKDHEFGYRDSWFKRNPNAVVLSTTFKLQKGNVQDISEKMDELMERRRDKQPLEFPNAGSVFKRPPGHFAGELIERCGLKGYAIGGAQVSQKHAGFIINTGNATCSDVLKLIEYIKNTVLKVTGVELECEICCV